MTDQHDRHGRTHTSTAVRRLLLLIGLAWTGLLPQAVYGASGEAGLPEGVGRLGDGLGAIVGAWVDDEFLFGVRWITLALGLAVLVLTGLADATLRLLVRGKLRRDEARRQHATDRERETRDWIDRGLRAAIPPLAERT